VTATSVWRSDHAIAGTVPDLWHGGQEWSCGTGHHVDDPHRSIVLIDRPGRSDYRVGIYSPLDQPVTASTGVFSFPGPATRGQNSDGRGFEPTELALELDAAIAADLTELGYGG